MTISLHEVINVGSHFIIGRPNRSILTEDWIIHCQGRTSKHIITFTILDEMNYLPVVIPTSSRDLADDFEVKTATITINWTSWLEELSRDIFNDQIFLIAT
jgi:hypothetical protein